MAKQIITSARQQDPASVREDAIAVLQEWQEEISKIYTVAFSGATVCDRETMPNERNLFLVIEDLSSSTVLPNALIQRINLLAKLAGVNVQSSERRTAEQASGRS